MAKKNYNRMALQGFKIDDMEFVKEYGLDPALAYTPAINDELMRIMYNKNVNGLIEAGVKEGKAKADAGRMRAEIKKDIARIS
ncbi:hypothetical protein N8602_00115 [bacterium]|nr:hypothetical protein [bacterium]